MQRHIDERRLLHALSLTVLATDETGVVAFANDAATELFRTERRRAGRPPGRRAGRARAAAEHGAARRPPAASAGRAT